MADIICWPWIYLRDHHAQTLDDFPSLRRWYEALERRPGFERGMAVGRELVSGMGGLDDEATRHLFGQR